MLMNSTKACWARDRFVCSESGVEFGLVISLSKLSLTHSAGSAGELKIH